MRMLVVALLGGFGVTAFLAGAIVGQAMVPSLSDDERYSRGFQSGYESGWHDAQVPGNAQPAGLRLP
jgi:hypothetical protein